MSNLYVGLLRSGGCAVVLYAVRGSDSSERLCTCYYRGKNRRTFTALKFPSQCSLVLLVKVG